MSGTQTFSYHRGVAPMMWVLFSLSIIEMFAVHFFVALKWPWIGWPLTILSALGVIWIFFWIRSFPTKPHRLDGDALLLRLGSLKSAEVALANIAQVRRGWEAGAVQAKGAMNLAGIAYPNRCIDLVKPVSRGSARVFIRLDDPDAFDEALAAKGVSFV